jgi:hypothetical protein
LDSLFKEYGNPTFLIDGLISSNQFCDWLDAQFENKEEETMWEYYIHKIGAWDNRSFDEFRSDIRKGRPSNVEIPTVEQSSATIKKSYDIIKQFEILEERG